MTEGQRPVADWDGEKGGFDDFEFTIEEASFGYDAQYDAAMAKRGVAKNTPMFIAVGTAKLADGSVHGNTRKLWSIGAFDPVDGGKRAVHESGEDRMFNASTNYMHLVKSARECGAPIEARAGDPLGLRNADIWVGLRFHMRKVTKGSFETDEGTKQHSPLIAVEYLGEVGGPSSDAGSQTSSTASASSTANGSVDLASLAAALNDKGQFLDAAVRAGADIADAEAYWNKEKANA